MANLAEDVTTTKVQRRFDGTYICANHYLEEDFGFKHGKCVQMLSGPAKCVEFPGYAAGQPLDLAREAAAPYRQNDPIGSWSWQRLARRPRRYMKYRHTLRLWNEALAWPAH